MEIKIKHLKREDEQYVAQAAQMLVDGFKIMAPNAWPNFEAGLEELHELLADTEEKFVLIAVNPVSNQVIGWIGGLQQNKQVWEIHPLVTAPALQGQGIGRALVGAFEEEVLSRGGSVAWLGSDDEANMTSLSGVDVYPQPLVHLQQLRNINGHPFEFYQKLGYTVVGMMPDANGFGKPDIFMAKRLKKVDV